MLLSALWNRWKEATSKVIWSVLAGNDFLLALQWCQLQEPGRAQRAAVPELQEHQAVLRPKEWKSPSPVPSPLPVPAQTRGATDPYEEEWRWGFLALLGLFCAPHLQLSRWFSASPEVSKDRMSCKCTPQECLCRWHLASCLKCLVKIAGNKEGNFCIESRSSINWFCPVLHKGVIFASREF